jgi:hypothetical protein
VRPPAPGLSRHGCVLEIDAAAFGANAPRTAP